MGTASTDSLFGWLLESSVDYIFSESIGVNISYDAGTLQNQLKSHNTTSGKVLEVSRLDSIVEKCENAIKDVHRPIVKSKTAQTAVIKCHKNYEKSKKIVLLNQGTYDFVSTTIRSNVPVFYRVKISGYNINTKRGRLYSPDLGVRTIPFLLHNKAHTLANQAKIINSMSNVASNPDKDFGFIFVHCFRSESKSGRLKSLIVIDVLTENQHEQLTNVLN